MKKTYEAPAAEAVKFEYKDQVVAASGACQYISKDTVVLGKECMYPSGHSNTRVM